MKINKILKKVIIVLLCIVISNQISCISGIVDAATTNVIEISTSEQMWKLAENVNNGNSYKGKTIKLTKDINLGCSENKQWVQIGYDDNHKFMGTFNGNNHTISNLYMLCKEKGGLFYLVGNTASVINTNFKNCNIVISTEVKTRASAIGIVASRNSGKITNCVTKNCEIRTDKFTTKKEHQQFIGGIVGDDEYGTINNCYSETKLEVKAEAILFYNKEYEFNSSIHATCGGIVGVGYNTKIYNSINRGAINNKSGNAGGIAGCFSGTISNCINLSNFVVSGNKLMSRGSGGIVGETSKTTTIKECANFGSIEGTGYYKTENVGVHLGGIIGLIKSDFDPITITVQDCYNLGNMTLNNSYSSLSTKFNTVCENGVDLGGIIGCAGVTYNKDTVKLSNLYSTGTVENKGLAGSIVGYVYNYPKTFTSQKIYKTSSLKTLGKAPMDNRTLVVNATTISSDNMKKKDFLTKINSGSNKFVADTYGINKGYPVLKNTKFRGWKTGTYKNKSIKYFFDKNGNITKGWLTYFNNKYYFNSNGILQTGLKTIGGKKYFFNDSGVMIKSAAKTIDNKRYYFGADGVMVTNKAVGKYWYDGNGVGTLDETKPSVSSINYSTKAITKEDVIVTITANEIIQNVTGWTLSSNKKSISKTYSSNIKETISVKDRVGNTTNANIEIANIDKIAPVIKNVVNNRDYSSSIKPVITDENLETVTLEKNGVINSNYVNGTEIVEVGTYKIKATDKAGNFTEVSFSIKDIPNTKEIVNYSLNIIQKTNLDVTVNATKKDEELYKNAIIQMSIDGMNFENKNSVTLSENGKVYIRVVWNNVIGEVIEVPVTNIKKRIDNLKITYSTNEVTNQNVIATISSNDELIPIEGWTSSNGNRQFTKEYTENTTESIRVKDTIGNEDYINVVITNIDKVAPNTEVDYSKENSSDNIVVTIKSNEKLMETDGWTLSWNKMNLIKIYEDCETENIIVKDFAGNEKEVEINIDEENPIIIGVTNEETYYENVEPEIIDENIDKIVLQKDGNIVPNYENGTEIYEIGNYKLTATDKLGNTTIVDFIIKYNRGDINNDKKVDMTDVLKILKYLSQEKKAEVADKHPDWSLDEKEKIDADIDKNGTIDMRDALKILKYISAKSRAKTAQKHPDWLNIE